MVRMKRKILGLLVLGIALVPFASSEMTTGPHINYVSETDSTVTADYFGFPANSQLTFVNSSTGATTTSVAAVSGTNTITVLTVTVPSGSYYLRATTPTGGFIGQTIMFHAPTLVRPVGQANLANTAGDRLFVQGKYAYVVEGGSYTNSFEIFDVSNPAAPVRVSQSNLTAFDQASIYIQGNYAYIAIGGAASQGFDIFDVSKPAAPILKSATDLNYGVPDDGIFVSGNYAYIAEGAGTTNAFQIFDVSNPSAPVLAGQADLANAGTIDTGGGDAIWVRDGFAYIGEGAGTTNAFEIFDVSNPATPSRVSQSPLANSGQPDDIFVSGNYAYIVEGGGTTNAFEIFDVSRFLPPDNL